MNNRDKMHIINPMIEVAWKHIFQVNIRARKIITCDNKDPTPPIPINAPARNLNPSEDNQFAPILLVATNTPEHPNPTKNLPMHACVRLDDMLITNVPHADSRFDIAMIYLGSIKSEIAPMKGCISA